MTRLEGALRPSPAAELRAAVERARRAPWLVLLLDYDGTLVPFAPSPELARPDPEVLQLLARLAARPATEVHVVSGRRREALERWFGALPVGLHAEHGFWSRLPGGAWTAAPVRDLRWREPARALLQDFTERTPGALVEEKTAGYAWHHRGADPDHGAARARELSLHLSALLGESPVEILQGDHVVELRPLGVDKGRAARLALSAAPRDAVVLAIGDDRTDEDLFAALPEGALSIHVGPAESRAALRVADVQDVRALLARIADGGQPR